jgi:hypothetical protein
MSMDTLHDLFVDELKDVYNAEKQLVAALPRMAKAATSPELAKAFTKHHQETKGHVARLEQAFKALDLPARGKKCKGMEGLLEEGKEILEEDGEDSVLDAALISAAQRLSTTRWPPMAVYVPMPSYLGIRTSSRCSIRRWPRRRLPTRNSRSWPKGELTRPQPPLAQTRSMRTDHLRSELRVAMGAPTASCGGTPSPINPSRWSTKR